MFSFAWPLHELVWLRSKWILYHMPELALIGVQNFLRFYRNVWLVSDVQKSLYPKWRLCIQLCPMADWCRFNVVRSNWCCSIERYVSFNTRPARGSHGRWRPWWHPKRALSRLTFSRFVIFQRTRALQDYVDGPKFGLRTSFKLTDEFWKRSVCPWW